MHLLDSFGLSWKPLSAMFFEYADHKERNMMVMGGTLERKHL
jgi:hypothetical protein